MTHKKQPPKQKRSTFGSRRQATQGALLAAQQRNELMQRVIERDLMIAALVCRAGRERITDEELATVDLAGLQIEVLPAGIQLTYAHPEALAAPTPPGQPGQELGKLLKGGFTVVEKDGG